LAWRFRQCRPSLKAQTQHHTAKAKDAPAEKKASFQGRGRKEIGRTVSTEKLASVDKAARTITVGKRTFQVTSGDEDSQAGKPGTFDDGVVGERGQRLCEADRRRQMAGDDRELRAESGNQRLGEIGGKEEGEVNQFF